MSVETKRHLDEACYGIGALASASFSTVPGLILLYYLTDTLAVPAGLAGLIVFIPKLFDVFANPLVGRLSDRTRTRFGARRPWIVFGGLVFPLAFIATFWTPYSGHAAALWVAVTFTLASMSFSAFVVPWSSLPAEIAPHTRARASMAAWRIAFLAVAVLISGGLAPTIVENGATPRDGYRDMALFMGTMMIAATLIVAFFGARRSTPATTQPAAPTAFGASIAILKSSPSLRAMLWLVALTEIASSVSLASTPYLADYVLGDPEAVAPMFIILTIPLLITMPLWRMFAVRRGKRAALSTALMLYALGALLLAALSVAPADARVLLTFVSVFVIGTGFAGTSMLPQAMFADALAYETSMRGESSVGAMVGLSNATETISGGFGAALFALVLTFTGFISTADDAVVEQPAMAIMGIVFAASLIPAWAALIARWPLRHFDLAEEDVDKATRGSEQDRRAHGIQAE